MASLFQIEQISKGGETAIGVAELSGVEKVLTAFVNQVIKDSTQNLDKEGINASMNLRGTIAPIPVQINGTEYTIEIEAASYWKYVNEGVQGAVSGAKAIGSPFKYTTKMPPRAAIADWITAKGISVGGTRGQRMQPRESIAAAIQRNVYRFGTKRTLFFDKALPESLQKALVEDVAEALGVNISISMKL